MAQPEQVEKRKPHCFHFLFLPIKILWADDQKLKLWWQGGLENWQPSDVFASVLKFWDTIWSTKVMINNSPSTTGVYLQLNDLSALAPIVSSHNLKNEFWLWTHSVESKKKCKWTIGNRIEFHPRHFQWFISPCFLKGFS